jgi:hypothetical protein
MRSRLLTLTGVAAAGIAAIVLVQLPHVSVSAQTPTAKPAAAAKAGPALKTAWGEPDLQGIWTDEYQTPLQRQAKYANREFFTDEERAAFDKQRAGLLGRDNLTLPKGTERDVAGAYNAVFTSVRHTGARTSMIVDPPDGRLPALTPEAQKRAAEDRAFRLSLLQATVTCKNKEPACAGGKYDPTRSARWNELTPLYNTGRVNRHNGPEDGSLYDRCMGAVLPDFGGFRRIVQSPGGITMFYDTSQGQGWQRNIVMNGSPHLPATITQWWGDSRGHWEGNTLVVDVTNFSPKTNFPLAVSGVGARDRLHLIERWTRIDANTLEYAVTIEDPTMLTKPWTVKQELTRQSEAANRIYYEPRCFEGNFGFPSMLLSERLEEVAFAEGRGPDPATKDRATDFEGVEDPGGSDPLAGN